MTILIAHTGSHAGSWALLVGMLAAAALGTAAVGSWRSRKPAWLLGAAVAGLGFQVAHALEHVLQAGYWVLNPSEAPWLTPWAAAGRDLLARADGSAVTGVEILHVFGNVAFMAGLVAAYWVVADRRVPRQRLRLLRGALAVQGLHLAEHVAITATWIALGRVVSISSLFGVMEPGTVVAWSYRVWLHFTFNTVATILAVAGFVVARRTVGAWSRHTRMPEGVPLLAAVGYGATTDPSSS